MGLVASAAHVAQLALRSCKMILVVRMDLGMGKGKMCAQCAHAAIEAYKLASGGTSAQRRALVVWDSLGSTKITVKVDSEAALLAVYDRAQSRGVVAAFIRDAGHTQVAPGTVTVLAVGPDDAHLVDEITGELKLL